MIDKATFGRRLKERRMACGLTQQMLADKSGISNYNRISNWEIGIAFPSLNLLCRLATALNCSVDYLLGLDEQVLEADELWCLEHYRLLGTERRKAVRSLISSLEGFRPADD